MVMQIIDGKDRSEVSTDEFAGYMTERFIEAHSMGGTIHVFNKAQELLGTLIQIMFERGECKTTMFPCHVWQGMYRRATKLIGEGWYASGEDGIYAAVLHMVEGLRKVPATDPKTFLY